MTKGLPGALLCVRLGALSQLRGYTEPPKSYVEEKSLGAWSREMGVQTRGAQRQKALTGTGFTQSGLVTTHDRKSTGGRRGSRRRGSMLGSTRRSAVTPPLSRGHFRYAIFFHFLLSQRNLCRPLG